MPEVEIVVLMMWFCEIGLHVRTPLKVDSRYALRDVDLKDMVVIDLWNAGEQRPVKTPIRRRVIPSQPVAGPGTSQNEAAGAQGWNHCFWTRALAHWTASKYTKHPRVPVMGGQDRGVPES